MNKYNIILIVVDAVRSFKTGKDEKDRLDIYNKLTENGFYAFDKLVVSAPSSVMSAITMLTGLPSFMLAQNYNDFQWEPELYDILPNKLDELKYDLYGLFGTKEMRDKMKQVFPPMKKHLLDQGINLNQKKWSNRELLGTVIKYFDNEISTKDNPFFLMTWFNSRFDWQTSDIIGELIDYLIKKNYIENSIVIVTADHGYPDQSRGLTSDGVDLKKAGIPHDLIVTDDNICVPLAIRFPKYSLADEKLSSQYSDRFISKIVSQECLTPTIYSILGIEYSPNKSIRPERQDIVSEILKQDNSPIRSDARFIFQPNRITSIRSDSYKYIIDREKKEEYFYNLEVDPYEKNKSTIDNNQKILALKNIYDKTEEKALQIWLAKISKGLKSYNFEGILGSSKECDVFFLGRTVFFIPFIQHLQEQDIRINLHVLDQNIKTLMSKDMNEKLESIKLIKTCKLDHAIIILEDSMDSYLVGKLKEIKASKILIIDILLNSYLSKYGFILKNKINYLLAPVNRMYLRRELYKSDYLLFFGDLTYITKKLIKVIFRKFSSIFLLRSNSNN